MKEPITATFLGELKGSLGGGGSLIVVRFYGDSASVTGDWRTERHSPEFLRLYDTYQHIHPVGTDPILTKGHW